MSADGVIGRDGSLPWHLPEDLKRFKALTSGEVVVMGRRTFESIGRLLPDRLNVVMTRDHAASVRKSADNAANLITMNCSVADALDTLTTQIHRRGLDFEDSNGDLRIPRNIWIIGGSSLYRQAMPRVTELHVTLVRGEYDGDTHFDLGWLEPFGVTDRVAGDGCDYLMLHRSAAVWGERS